MTKQTRRRLMPAYEEQAVTRLMESGMTYSGVAA